MGPALGIFWFVAMLVLFIVAIGIAVAPLLIWRNTNRMNRLMVLLLAKEGFKKEVLDRVWNKGGDEFKYIFEKTPIEEYESKTANK